VLEGRWEEGFVAIVAVGATNVSSVRVCILPNYELLFSYCWNITDSTSKYYFVAYFSVYVEM
jgi:phosphatidylserine decarboxylase